jgi:hypothetical protein
MRAGRVDEGYAVPNDQVREALAYVSKPLSTACVVR